MSVFNISNRGFLISIKAICIKAIKCISNKPITFRIGLIFELEKTLDKIDSIETVKMTMTKQQTTITFKERPIDLVDDIKLVKSVIFSLMQMTDQAEVIGQGLNLSDLSRLFIMLETIAQQSHDQNQ